MATTTNYSKKSAYAVTGFNDFYLDLLVKRNIPKYEDDVIFTINETYNMNPSLLAFDLYGDEELWWVFTARNPDILKNPIHDFNLGTEIFLPKLSTLRSVLGF